MSSSRTIGIVAATCLSIGGSAAMAAGSPSQQCGRILNGGIYRIEGVMIKAISRVCAGAPLDEVAAKATPTLNSLLTRIIDGINKVGSCDPDFSVTFPVPPLPALTVADVTAAIQSGTVPLTSSMVLGAPLCNGVDDP